MNLTYKAIALMCGYKMIQQGSVSSNWFWVRPNDGAVCGSGRDTEERAARDCCIMNRLTTG